MKYFLDTEFIEGKQTLYQWRLKTDTWLRMFSIPLLLIAIWLHWYFQHNLLEWIVVGLLSISGIFLWSLSMPSSPPTIDLISIGIVREDNKRYYAISKDFNLREAWNRYDEKINPDYKPSFGGGQDGHYNPQTIKVYWIRENVLKPIFTDLYRRAIEDGYWLAKGSCDSDFRYSTMKELINHYGKTNQQIAKELKDIVAPWNEIHTGVYPNTQAKDVQFYGYYCDYDWVVFCWLFGRMVDLPKGFPMYCKDLKQILDEKCGNNLGNIKSRLDYPKQTNEHNALADAKWNKALYDYICKL